MSEWLDLRDAAADFLKGGQHEGYCEIMETPSDGCRIHMATHNLRKTVLEIAVQRVDWKIREEGEPK